VRTAGEKKICETEKQGVAGNAFWAYEQSEEKGWGSRRDGQYDDGQEKGIIGQNSGEENKSGEK